MVTGGIVSDEWYGPTWRVRPAVISRNRIPNRGVKLSMSEVFTFVFNLGSVLTVSLRKEKISRDGLKYKDLHFEKPSTHPIIG